jgi:hypothetical protein
MPSLADLRFAAQSVADRINASTITPAEWNLWVNDGAQELYGILTSTYQDYNCKIFAFTLAGTASGNSLYVGVGSPPAGALGPVCPDFFMPRLVGRQVMSNGATPYYATVPRLNSLFEKNLHVGPAINPLYGQTASYWNLTGNTLALLPPDSAAGNYELYYVPRMPLMINDVDTVDQYWLSVNGWDQYIRKYAAAEALTKEESLETAGYLRQQLSQLKDRILRECAPRDDSQPAKITDVKRVRSNFGFGNSGDGWGSPGF